jgi:hypothetical protein
MIVSEGDEFLKMLLKADFWKVRLSAYRLERVKSPRPLERTY